MSPRATESAFRRWLTNQPANAWVGYRKECAECPLAEFLAHIEPGCWPHVDLTGHWTRWVGSDRWRPMPAWALRVMHIADGLQTPSISAGQLLAALGWS